MQRQKLNHLLLAVFITMIASSLLAAQTREISVEDYLDKMKGGWAGQMIGVSYGSVYEFKAQGRTIEGPLRKWEPRFVSNSIHQDDLYVEMTFLESLENRGINITSVQAGKDFAQSKYRLWHANRSGRDNIRRGIMPPDSGNPKYNPHADDIDFQIESDLFGLICPGLPQASNNLCNRFGHIMNYGDGVYGGMFVTAMYTQAFFEKDIQKIVQTGLRAIPPTSRYAMLIRDVLNWHKQYPSDWRKCWRQVEIKWAHEDRCPGGWNRPFNIDAKVNGAYIAIGLLYGNGDFEKTLEITTRCGQDADCNPSNSGGILGTVLGYQNIPHKFTAGLNAIKNRKFSYTSYDFDSLSDACLSIATKIVKSSGGRLLEREGKQYFVIPIQNVVPPQKLEQWSGSPDEWLKAAVKEWDPSWEIIKCGSDMNPGLRAEYHGRKKVLVTHPFDRQTPCALTRKIELPPNSKPHLELEVASSDANDRADWELRVFVDNHRIAQRTIGRVDGKVQWHRLSFDLAPYAGKTVTLRLENAPNGWAWEAAYWAKADVIIE